MFKILLCKFIFFIALFSIYSFTNFDTFFKIIPYDQKDTIIENETICSFIKNKQGTGEIDKNKKFPDCVETVFRHTFNLLFFDFKAKKFVIPKSQINPASEQYIYLLNFYKLQTINEANSSNIFLHEAFNKAMANLPHVRYNHSFKNEIYPGFINFIRVIENIFGLKVQEPLPKNKEDWIYWVKKSLPEIFYKLNPHLSYEIKLEYLNTKSKINKDVLGIAHIKVSKENEDFFSFTIEEMADHARVSKIMELKKNLDD